MIKTRIYRYLKRSFEEEITLIKTETTKDDTAKPIKTEIEHQVKGIVLNQKTGYKLLQQLDNSRLDSDKTLDILFSEKIKIIPKLKDIIVYENKRYQINKMEDNTKFSDFWKGEIVELNGNQK